MRMQAVWDRRFAAGSQEKSGLQNWSRAESSQPLELVINQPPDRQPGAIQEQARSLFQRRARWTGLEREGQGRCWNE